MDAQKVKTLTDITKSSFDIFLGLNIFMVMGNAFYHLLTKLYENIQKNILDPVIDPNIPSNFLELHFGDKITIKLGSFLVELSKTLILAYVTYQIFLLTEPYFKYFLKRGG